MVKELIKLLYNTTYKDNKIIQQINDLVGKPFNLWEAFKLKGVGSKRMIIDEVSPNLQAIVNRISDVNYGSLELRPKGVLIHIGKGLQRFTWVIPYYKLVIYKINGASIHADGKFVHFRPNKTYKENKVFFKKLLDQKINFDAQFSTIPYNE
ncbi:MULTISPECIES: hypothetical protein [Mesoflavibacter]|uniref:Arginyl-tRNA synthetase n=1 Tax=Mesoflavibacter profundi TaxID=2708110 RepID=A0ABT4RZI1_9FLAO|nr:MULTISPECIES: hypothetical protein [Mesoflavibacter]MDA0176920.1 hypothetical protein [Mesoflavibacter profundi]QIJ87835.1 hypothetical protein C7H62_0025 [Mesoflavibacter sp. HG96]QIJ90563.1 hypothetical protein C7H56_0025 [Mesoflavibacter sp. HG37]